LSRRLASCLSLLTAPAPTPIYTLSLHDALPISGRSCRRRNRTAPAGGPERRATTEWCVSWEVSVWVRGCLRRALYRGTRPRGYTDRKSTRLNSSHVKISYAVFCLKKKKTTNKVK